jgi:chemotaxis regulatin CheY-phosphate phosphatase CheZ
MSWWRRGHVSPPAGATSEEAAAAVEGADEAVREARDATRRVEKLTRTVQAGLKELEVHRRDNHILDAMMETLGRHR